MSVRHDPSLALPRFPPEPVSRNRLDGPGDAVAYAGRARRVPVVLGTARTRVEADEVRGVGRMVLDGVPVLEGVEAGVPPASAVRVGPWSLRREVVGPRGTVLETVLVAERFPGAVLQWAGAGARELTLRCRLPREAVAWNAAEGVLRVDLRPERAAQGAGRRAVLLRAVPPGTWRVEREGSADTAGPWASVTPGDGDTSPAGGPEGPITLFVAAGGDAGEAEAALTAIGRLRAVAVRADAAVEELGREGLVLETGVTELDDGLAWARARLGAAAPTPDAPLGDAVSILGLLAVADHEAARKKGEALVARLAGTVGGGRRQDADTAALLTAGWLATWAGDPGTAGRHRPALARAAARLLDDPHPVAAPLVRAAVRALADALDGLGDREGASGLREDAAGPVPSGPRGRAGMALPMAGRPVPSPPAPTPPGGESPSREHLAAALDPEAPLPPPPGETGEIGETGPGAMTMLAAWARWGRSDPDAAYLLFREGLGAPRDEASAPFLDGPLAAALVPLALLMGLLGVRPDAPFGRLRIAPRLPGSWRRFRVRGLRAGDATMTLGFHADEGARTFELLPTAGRAPLNVILEPLVPGPVGTVLVDGSPAEVDRFTAAGRTGVRLQLPVDRERTVTLLRPGG